MDFIDDSSESANSAFTTIDLNSLNSLEDPTDSCCFINFLSANVNFTIALSGLAASQTKYSTNLLGFRAILHLDHMVELVYKIDLRQGNNANIVTEEAVVDNFDTTIVMDKIVVKKDSAVLVMVVVISWEHNAVNLGINIIFLGMDWVSSQFEVLEMKLGNEGT